MNENKITKKDLNKMFWRSNLIQFSHNYERMQSVSTVYALTPIFKRLYKDKSKEERVAAQERHLAFFNSHPVLIPFILGIVAAMEETTTEDEKDSVIAVKTSLMGPLAGLGDSLLNFTWYPIAGSIGAALAIQGNPLGPLVMFLIINLLYFPLKYYGIHLGYSKGRDLLTSGSGKKVLDRVTNAASVVGVMVAGGLITSVVNINLGIVFGEGETEIIVQEMLDEVMPNFIPLAVTLACVYFMRKYKGKHVIKLIFGLLIGSVILSMLGILG